MRRLLLVFLALCGLAASAAPETYVIDPAHSSVTFTVRHFLARVPGWFAKFNGSVVLDRANPAASTVEATIDVATVSTNQENRDKHLNTADFFDTANHPTATFQSKSWQPTGGDHYDVTGDLTLHGVTRAVVLKVRHLGFADGNRGAKLSGWEATTTLRRADFAVGKPERSIGDEVEIVINIEARLQASETPKAP
jgi:polyisoprenoid-binding protein YceI